LFYYNGIYAFEASKKYMGWCADLSRASIPEPKAMNFGVWAIDCEQKIAKQKCSTRSSFDQHDLWYRAALNGRRALGRRRSNVRAY
jgi:hypothetical protein